jgi:hypothetical protein
MIEKPIESATTQNVNSVPSTILSNHTKRIFDEANRLKAEYGGCVASLEHELEILRKWRFVVLVCFIGSKILEINKPQLPTV